MLRIFRSKFFRFFGVGSGGAGPYFVVHKRYQLNTPFPQYDGQRPFRILAYLETRKLLRKGSLRRPRAAAIAQLELAHDREYLRSMEEPGALTPILGMELNPEHQDRFLCFQRLVCGGTLRSARLAEKHRAVAVNLGGGFHHAAHAHGAGFCVFNDVAIAVKALRAKGREYPMLVIDLDLHDGDGTRSIFADDPTVHTFSIHNRHLGEVGATESTSLALGSDVGDQEYLAALEESLPAVVADFRPGLVFYLAGSDPCIDDKLGDWRVTLEGMLQRDRRVMELLRGVPTVILPAGGYGPRAWRHGAAFLSWIMTGDSRLEIPAELELPVDHFRRLTRHMRTHPLPLPDEAGDQVDAEDDWGLREEDVAPPGREETHFLGAFSRYGVEMALEDYGLLDRFRDLGFKELDLSLDLKDPLGHTLRIQTGGPDPLVVFETRLRIDKASIPDHAMLSIEWLLFQDTRSTFEMNRPLLPGQKYPGLGLLRETAAVFIVLAERLELDGLLFTPSHYHLAALSRPLGHSPDPTSEGRHQALTSLLKGVRLPEAGRVVEGSQIWDEAAGEVYQWQPSPVVIPVSEPMKEFFASPDYRTRVQAAMADQRLRRL
jgi:acetoin utilization deacetylase AcuC-like enzyme